MSDETKEETTQEEVLAEEAVQQAWWRESAFVNQGQPRNLITPVGIPSTPDLFDTLKDITPALREEGELTLLGRTFTGFTEWIPGIDPVGELIEDTWLPPLPPAVTTRMRTFEDEEGDLPGGGGHLNMVVDLSGSMSSPIGKNGSKRDVSIAEAAMCMCAILIQGCRDGGHTFSIAGYGTSGGRYTVSPLDVNALANESSPRFWQETANSTRLIWGGDAQQRKDYAGARDSIVNSVSSENSSQLWSYMGGTNSGCGMARMYYYMKEKMKGTEVRTAPCIFLSDCTPYDLDVADDFYENIGGDPQKPKLDTKRMSEIGRDNHKSSGFWYWAKKYSQEFGPVILIQMLDESDYERVQNNDGYSARLNAAFVQYIGEGYPASEYEKCFLSLKVVMTPQGGNLIDVALRLNEFIKNMNGEGEICCGGKGISF
tara:strand:- start:12960 stop:14243 length:1284 start_codon:yes stop_codon:yes gene_type:complete